MNKKGQTIFLTVIVGIFLFIFGILFLTFINTEKDNAMLPESTNENGQTIFGLNCDDSTISDGNKLTCLGLELVIPYFIIAIVGIAGVSIMARFRK